MAKQLYDVWQMTQHLPFLPIASYEAMRRGGQADVNVLPEEMKQNLEEHKGDLGNLIYERGLIPGVYEYLHNQPNRPPIENPLRHGGVPGMNEQFEVQGEQNPNLDSLYEYLQNQSYENLMNIPEGERIEIRVGQQQLIEQNIQQDQIGLGNLNIEQIQEDENAPLLGNENIIQELDNLIEQLPQDEREGVYTNLQQLMKYLSGGLLWISSQDVLTLENIEKIINIALNWWNKKSAGGGTGDKKEHPPPKVEEIEKIKELMSMPIQQGCKRYIYKDSDGKIKSYTVCQYNENYFSE